MAGEDADEAAIAAPRRRSRARRAGKWAAGILAAVLLALVAAIVVLNTPLGERFIAQRIAERTFPNGLNIRIGRIEGDIYGEAVLHDVVLSDPKGVFLTIPRAEVDWNPRAWLSNRLDIDYFTARRAKMLRVPEFLPSKEDTPFLPGFDISIDRLTIDNLTLAPGIAGERAQRVDLTAEVQVEDRRLYVDAKGTLGREDRFALLLDAEPDGDDFELGLDVDAAADGAIAGLLGLDEAYTARIRGDGTWSNWKGAFVVRGEDERVAALRITNRAGLFGLLGKVDPSDFVGGTLGRALGDDVALSVRTRIDNRVLDGRYVVVGTVSGRAPAEWSIWPETVSRNSNLPRG